MTLFEFKNTGGLNLRFITNAVYIVQRNVYCYTILTVYVALIPKQVDLQLSSLRLIDCKFRFAMTAIFKLHMIDIMIQKSLLNFIMNSWRNFKIKLIMNSNTHIS